MAAVRSGKAHVLALDPPFHVSDADKYLIIPSDIGVEIIDIAADADFELMAEAFRDSLLVCGSVEQQSKKAVTLSIESTISPEQALARGMPYAHEIESSAGVLLAQVNALPPLRCTMTSALLDDDGLDQVLGQPEYLGVSWRPPVGNESGVDPSFTWSKHLPDGRIGIELALFQEYEELVIALRPAVLRVRVE